MRRRALLLSAALLAAATQTTTSAHATTGSVDAVLASVNQPLGNGVVSVAVCSAQATPAGPLEIPVVTSVWCEINGFPSATISVPGPNAAVVNGNATTLPVEICVHALAVFSPTIGAPYTATDTECQYT